MAIFEQQELPGTEHLQRPRDRRPARQQTPYHDWLSERAAHDEIAVRTDSRKVPFIMADRRVFSQHDTRTSNGALDPGLRTRLESGMGIPNAKDSPPVYGYLHDTRDMTGANRVSNYGDVDLVMKPHVRDRTTMTASDSLDTHTMYARPEGEHLKAARLSEVAAKQRYPSHTPMENDPGVLQWEQPGYHYGYLEAQVQPPAGERGVPVSDVAKARIWHRPPGESYRRNDAQDAENSLRDHGIPVEHWMHGMYHQPELPLTRTVPERPAMTGVDADLAKALGVSTHAIPAHEVPFPQARLRREPYAHPVFKDRRFPQPEPPTEDG